MSNSAPSPAFASINETVNALPPSPPLPDGGTAPPPSSESPPPLVSPPSPPASASNATSEPPSSSKQNEAPPPPPPDNSSPPPPPPFSTISPPPPQPSNSPPSSSAPSPPHTLNNSALPLPAAPAQPQSPPNRSPPTSQDSLPSPPTPVTFSLIPGNSLVTPPPPGVVTPSLTPPSQLIFPPGSEEPVSFPVSPALPETSPSTSIPSPSTVITPANPAPSTTPDTRLPDSSSQSGLASSHTHSSSSNGTSKTSSHSLETVAGATFAGVLVVFVAVIFVALQKRRRKHSLMSHYTPPATFSGNSDGFYRQANQVGSSHSLGTFHASKPPFSSDTGYTSGSYRGYALHGGPSVSVGIGSSQSSFTYEEIAEMTHGFSRESLLGEGGFGCVYKGWLLDGKVVAVKQLKSGSGQGEREFRAEVEIISRVHHRHLVSLVGYCIADNQRSLVYEFVPNNTLEHHLHGKGLAVIDWQKRLKIAIGSARGLAYLHEDCHPRIIHRDIKSANILLDNAFEAQVADFGLAKLSNDTHTHVSTRVMGTFGYMAPEYASSGKLTDRSDVFSFGVVLLELITGRKPVDPSQPLGDESLVEWARPRLLHSLETGDFEELVDSRLEDNYVKSQMFRMIEAAAACVRHSAPKRPRMVQVLRALDNEELPDLSNGIKFGQSTVFESRQYSADIQQFRRMAFGSGDYSSDYGQSGEYDRRSQGYSGEHRTREAPDKPLNSWTAGESSSGEYTSGHHAEPWGISRRGSERGPEGKHQFSGRGHF